jgi:hypothetical protein
MARTECTCSSQQRDAADVDRLRGALYSLSRKQEAYQLLIYLSSFVNPADQEAYFTMLNLLSDSLKDGINSCMRSLG